MAGAGRPRKDGGEDDLTLSAMPTERNRIISNAGTSLKKKFESEVDRLLNCGAIDETLTDEDMPWDVIFRTAVENVTFGLFQASDRDRNYRFLRKF